MNEQDYCTECDRVVTITDVHEETDVQTIYGTGPTYTVYDFDCGHQVAVPTGRIG